MNCTLGRDVIGRCDENPIVSLRDIPFRCSDIWNAGVVHHQGRYVLLITIETLEGRYTIHRAESEDGRHFTVEPEPLMASTEEGPMRSNESIGVRDARITPVNGGYLIAYVADGEHGLRVALAETEDLVNIRRLGCVTQVDVKNGAMFPRKIGGRYALLTRPDAGASIWLGYSDDLEFWGSETAVLTPRGGFWDSNRVGAAAPPIEVDGGWLLLYYGCKDTSAGPLVRLGAAILDHDDPSRVLARSNVPILSPRERYERIGDVPNVVFSCGALCEDGILKVYYGASDSCICLGEAPLEDVLTICREEERGF
jgi:predicted GH43/DUF377 family glycosyl hydrolase